MFKNQSRLYTTSNNSQYANNIHVYMTQKIIWPI